MRLQRLHFAVLYCAEEEFRSGYFQGSINIVRFFNGYYARYPKPEFFCLRNAASERYRPSAAQPTRTNTNQVVIFHTSKSILVNTIYGSTSIRTPKDEPVTVQQAIVSRSNRFGTRISIRKLLRSFKISAQDGSPALNEPESLLFPSQSCNFNVFMVCIQVQADRLYSQALKGR